MKFYNFKKYYKTLNKILNKLWNLIFYKNPQVKFKWYKKVFKNLIIISHGIILIMFCLKKILKD